MDDEELGRKRRDSGAGREGGRAKTPIFAFGVDHRLHVFSHQSSIAQHIASARSAARSGGLVDVEGTVAEVRGFRARTTAEVIDEDSLERRALQALATARARAKYDPEFTAHKFDWSPFEGFESRSWSRMAKVLASVLDGPEDDGEDPPAPGGPGAGAPGGIAAAGISGTGSGGAAPMVIGIVAPGGVSHNSRGWWHNLWGH